MVVERVRKVSVGRRIAVALCAPVLALACGGRVGDGTRQHSRIVDDAGGPSTGTSSAQPGPSTTPPSGTASPIANGAGTTGAGGANAAGAPSTAPPPSNAGAPSGGASTATDGGGSGNPGSGGAGNGGVPTGPLADDLRFYTLASATAEGRLVGARWNGTEEVVALIDPVTATAEVVGVLGDLHSWSNDLVYEPWSRTVYAVGYDAAGASHLYSLSLGGGGPWSVSLDRGYLIGGSNGDLFGAYWTGTEEALVQIAPSTGDALTLGALGDLRWWSDQLVYDMATHTAYATGGNDSTTSNYFLYAFSVASRTCTSMQIAHAYAFADVTDAGEIIAAYWNDSEEVVVLIDPAAGFATHAGILGDLRTWSGQMAYDRNARMLYAIGMDANDVAHIYGLSLGG